MKSCLTKEPNGHGSLYKEVRFSPTATPAMTPSSTLEADYLEQVRSLLERQRENFEAERAVERRIWEKERALLKSRISELEASAISTRPGLHHPNVVENHSDRIGSSLPNISSQVWEGSSPGSPPTRVFHTREKALHEDWSSLSLDRALSPRSRATDASMSVPIEKLDSKLDGITLKSTALPPEVVARVMTPPSPAAQSLETSPSSQPPVEHKSTLKLKLSELGPPDKNLTRDAGHTPMVAVVDAIPDANGEDEADGDGDGTPPIVEAVQPRENSDSYFPDLPEDPALKGPLSLLNEEEHDRGFLEKLDQKLLEETRQALSGPSSDGPQGQDADVATPVQGEQEPELKFKNTTNFGTAFGESKCGGL